jgi:urease accessory protein
MVVQRPLRGPTGQAVLVLLTPAGALFEGDTIHLNVHCGPGCDVTLLTAAATKLNRCDHQPIRFTLEASLAAGATLRCLPHELIPFPAARYRQRLSLSLEADSQATLLDVLTPGRSGQPFAYTRLDFETEVRRHGQLALRERFSLAEGVAARLGGHTHYGSLLLLDGTSRDPRAVAGSATQSLAQAGACAAASALPAAAGIAIKMLGDSAREIRQALLRAAGCPAWLRAFTPP